jgi:hypothetical protein
MAKVTLNGYITLSTAIKNREGKVDKMSPKAVKKFLEPADDQEYTWQVPFFDAEGNQIGTLTTGGLRLSKNGNLTANLARVSLNVGAENLVLRQKVDKAEKGAAAPKKTANDMASELLDL